MRSKKRRQTNCRQAHEDNKITYENKKIGGAKSSYDDYLDGTYKLLLELSRMCNYNDSFKEKHLYLYGYDDFVGVNKLIPIKEYVGFTGQIVQKSLLTRNMPMYYYISELVFRYNIITEKYYGWRISRYSSGGSCKYGGSLRTAEIRGYVREEDTITGPSSLGGRHIKPHSNVGIPPQSNPKAWDPIKWTIFKRNSDDYLRKNPQSARPPDDGSVSDAYIDKFLYFPRQDYKYVVIKPSRESNIYHTEVGEIELNEPGGEPWFDLEQVCIVLDEFFIPPPLESQEQTFDTRGVAEEMLKREHDTLE